MKQIYNKIKPFDTDYYNKANYSKQYGFKWKFEDRDCLKFQ